MPSRRRVLLVQLPIPPVGPEPIRGNVPLAAGYLKLYAESRGLGERYDIGIFPPREANTLGDRGLVAAILDDHPWMVGFTCYLWNIDRTLWIARQLKQRRPDLLVVLGGPEITADNAWVLAEPAIDYAAIGEGEQTFAELLRSLWSETPPIGSIAGLYVHQAARAAQNGTSCLADGASGKLSLPPLAQSFTLPAPRKPLANLNEISSPYLAGILDAADEEMLLLETIRGCIFKCKFCYYPKSYDGLYFLPAEKIVANLEHARRRGAREVVLLDPTLNQRKDFPGFLRLLADCNPDRQYTYFGELRAEGITAEVARLLRLANFSEVEIGLQSIDPLAMDLMDRKNNLRAFERGARAMLDEGIKVKVDLIIGLPGDTVDSVRRGLHYVRDSGLYTTAQVFNLAILPGTAFRQEAEQLGLVFQDRPPYYVLRTPTLDLEQMYDLMDEAQELFETEFDHLGPPVLEFERDDELVRCRHVDLDERAGAHDWQGCLGAAERRAQAFTLRLHSADFEGHRQQAQALVSRVLEDNPYTTLQVVLQTEGDPRHLTTRALEDLRQACYARPTYLDRFYSVLPGQPKGAKRLVALLPAAYRNSLAESWIRALAGYATIVWDGDLSKAEADETVCVASLK